MIDDPEMMAAELALGVLDGPERAAALRCVLAEPDFAAEVEWWRGQLATLFEQVPASAPDPALFGSIVAGIDDRGAPRARPGRFWPGIAAVTGMAAAAMLALVVLRPAPAPVAAPAPLLAALAPVGSGEPLGAVYDPAAGTLRLTAAALVTAGHSAELWVIGGDGVPHALGLLPANRATTMTVASADRPRLAAAAVLAVSIEPAGGSPTGLPTGPVVAKGALSRT